MLELFQKLIDLSELPAHGWLDAAIGGHDAKNFQQMVGFPFGERVLFHPIVGREFRFDRYSPLFS